MAGTLHISNATAGTILADRATAADTFIARLVGLLGRRGLAEGEGLVLQPCQAVHTMFMRFPIDLVFADRSMRVVRTASAVPPFRQSAFQRDAVCVIELPAGTVTATQTKPGDQIVLLRKGG